MGDFCSVIQQSIEETPLILGENLLDTEIIKDLEIANNQETLSIIFLDDVTDNQKARFMPILRKNTNTRNKSI